MARFCLPAFLFVLLFVAGCATQSRPSKVGDTDYDARAERHLQAERDVEDHYDQVVPRTSTVIRSNPPGALVEWFNDEGTWVAIGNTPTSEVVIEATGRPELFRVSAPGYLPKTRWVAAMPDGVGEEVSFELIPAGPGDIRLSD